MMIIAAFDLGSNMAMAATGRDPIHFVAKGSREVRAAQTMDWITESLYDLVAAEGHADVVIYERPFARGQDATRCLWGIAGILEALATAMGIAVVDVTPGEIKMFATGRGDADKAMMQDAAWLLGYVGDNEHEADAFCLLKFAEAKLTTEKTNGRQTDGCGTGGTPEAAGRSRRKRGSGGTNTRRSRKRVQDLPTTGESQGPDIHD